MKREDCFKRCAVCKQLIDLATTSATSWDNANWMHIPCSRDINKPRLREMLLAVTDALAICDHRLETGPDPMNLLASAADDRRLLVAVRAHLAFRWGELAADYHYNAGLPDWWEKFGDGAEGKTC